MKSKNKPIRNLVCFRGQWITEIDKKVRLAFEHGKKNDIVPRREHGKIIGYYVLNEGGETAIETI